MLCHWVAPPILILKQMYCYGVCVCVCVCHSICVKVTGVWSLLLRVAGRKLKRSGLPSRCLYPLRHLASIPLVIVNSLKLAFSAVHPHLADSPGEHRLRHTPCCGPSHPGGLSLRLSVGFCLCLKLFILWKNQTYKRRQIAIKYSWVYQAGLMMSHDYQVSFFLSFFSIYRPPEHTKLLWVELLYP